MARRGGAATRSFLPVAAIIAVLLFLGVVVLLVRSGHNPSGPGLGVSSPSPSPTSPSSPGGGSPSPSTVPATPSPSTVAPSAAPAPGAVGPSAGPVTPPAGATAPAGGVPPQAAGPGSMPNTGPPFPWWMGLIPVSLGIGLMRALRRRPEPMGVTAGGGTVWAARDRRPVSRPRGRPASGLGRKRP